MLFNFKARLIDHKFKINNIYIWYKPFGLGEHFEYGPAIVCFNGIKEYWLNGKPHRTNGPAVIGPDKYQVYFVNGYCHRLDGPAMTFKEHNSYYIKGHMLSEKEWRQRREVFVP